MEVLVSELSSQYFTEGYNVKFACTPRYNTNISSYLWKFGGRSVSLTPDTYQKDIDRSYHGTKVVCKPKFKNGEFGKETSNLLQVLCK